jgi:hypothetical protein
MSGTQKPLPGADAKHFVAISYPLDWEKTQKYDVADHRALVLARRFSWKKGT